MGRDTNNPRPRNCEAFLCASHAHIKYRRRHVRAAYL
uniref:Uncharacterized protein n=1 Tax=Siphoviridae sp. ctsYA13 TaxID=2825695 RepID=A0A8S5VBR6_9CAUD|nr:MAG TPA: hypothetical protein [Siphoviridae sp. ctsYA13]